MSPDAQARQVTASDTWTWIEDYVDLKATYQLNCPSDRRCVVTGGRVLLAKFMPGRLVRWSGTTEVQVIGTGSLRVRVDDDRGTCVIGVTRTTSEPIVPFPEV